MKHEKIARLLALVLTFCLIVGVFPLSAGATGMDNAQSIRIGDTISGQISVEGEEDVYSFILDDTGAVTLDITSYMEWYSLYIYDVDGNVLWSAENKQYQSSVEFRKDSYIIDLEEGTYYLKVDGTGDWGAQSTGNYTIPTSFKSANVTETESNDVAGNADAFPLSGTIRGQISVDDDADFYKITVTDSGAITLGFTSYMEWYSLRVIDSDGENLWSDEDNQFDSTVGFRQDEYRLDLEEGIYYLRVDGTGEWSASTTGNYTIQTTFSSANVTESEPNDSARESNPLSLNDTVKGQISLGGDIDYYELSLPSGATITVDIISYIQWYSISLVDETGDSIWAANNKEYNSNVGFRQDQYEIDLEPGTYYLKVDGTGEWGASTTGNYTLWIGTGVPPENPDEENPEEPEEPSGLPFTDVRSGDYFYAPVQWAVEKNITSGTSATTFSPNQACTRAQAVMFLWKAAGQPEPTCTSNPFLDVKSSDYYYKAVLWAVENNITSGTSDTTFSPNQSCTRGQIMTFLYKAAGSPSVSGSNPFRDVAYGDYFYRPVLWAVRNDITSGTSATAFSPSASCTRGQIVTFLYKHYA